MLYQQQYNSMYSLVVAITLKYNLMKIANANHRVKTKSDCVILCTKLCSTTTLNKEFCERKATLNRVVPTPSRWYMEI